MNFISLLQAGGAPSLLPLGMLILMFAVLYFLVLRPQKKEQKKFQESLSNLKKGDKVMTVGGIYGTISSTKENSFILKVDENCKIEISKNGIGSIIDSKAKAAAEAKKTSNTVEPSDSDKKTEKNK